MMKRIKTMMTLYDLKKSACASLNSHLFEKSDTPVNKSKYGNQRIEVAGEAFDSKKEVGRYKELLLLLKAGEIGQLRRQVEYELNPGGTHSLKYRADFVYMISATGEIVVEDVKGYCTREYKKKRRLMKKVHRITIKET